jgi:hypothetical protein
MTDDIVMRLRTWAPLVSTGHEVPAAGQVMFTAADEIERLRAALWDQLNDCINFDGGKLTDSIMARSSAVLKGE